MIRILALACMVVALGAPSASAQFLIFWDQEEGDWNVSDNWFEGFGPPDVDLGDVGVISNGGLAFLDSDARQDAGGVILGERAGESGTLHLRDGGALNVVEDNEVAGDVRVGQSGLGTLIIDRGAELASESLRTGGHADSGIVLGGGDSGSATVTVNGPAIINRHARVIGSSVSFESNTLNLSGQLTAEILGEDHSTLAVNETATLGGSLHLDFAAPFQPAVGNTWNLVDAEAINGNFAEVTSNVSPGPGLAFAVNKVAGGDNGMLAQLGLEARLQLTVDRRSGASQIQNLTEEQPLTINGYGVGSPSGVLNDGNWQRLEGEGWAGNGSSTHVSEISLGSSQELAPGANVELGNVYAFEPAALGEANEDVVFEYHVAGGDVVSGIVDFTGAHNDVVLVVDDDGAYIQNQSTSDITMNGYAIVSRSGGLDPADWTSLADGDATWTEANAAANHMTELNLSGNLVLPATGEAIPLGDIVGAGAQDLEFIVNLAETGPHIATVEYDDGVIDFSGPFLGDCNGDGVLSAADLACVSTIEERDAVLDALNTLPGDLDGNGDVAFGDFLVLSNNFGQPEGAYTDGNIDLEGGVEFGDFLVLSSNFGQAPAAAVPEPTYLGWMPLALVLWWRWRRR